MAGMSDLRSLRPIGALALLCAALLLVGCGTKPAELTPPDPERSTYPRSYPVD